MIIDTHCHIQFQAYKNDYLSVLKNCEKSKMQLITVGTQLETSENAIHFAKQYDYIFASIGLHPIHLISKEIDEEEVKFKSHEEEFNYDKYYQLGLNKKVVAIGECGMDLFHIPPNLSTAETLDIQTKAFLLQYSLAQDLNLPLIIHVRDAHDFMIKTLKNQSKQTSGVIHCYTSNWENAFEYLNMGLHIGFTGIITYPPKKSDYPDSNYLLEVLKKCPLDRMLIETDAPYLAPQTYRGKKCEPWMVIETAKKIAEIKNISTDKLIEQVNKNALKLFSKMSSKLEI